MTTDDLVAFGGTAVLILPMIYFATGRRRENTLKWMRSDTRGAKLCRAFFGDPRPREPLCLPKNPQAAKKYWGTVSLLLVVVLACLIPLFWGNNLPWARSLAAQRCVSLTFAISLTILLFLTPFKRSHYWPSALTEELIEGLYRPQIERLREIATHFSQYNNECKQQGATRALDAPWTPLATDLELFSIASVFSATVTTSSPNEWVVVGGLYRGDLPADTPRIVESTRFLPRNPPEAPATSLIPACIKLSDYSRKNAVIYHSTLIDDGGEKRKFELWLNLKMLISQIPKSRPSPP